VVSRIVYWIRRKSGTPIPVLTALPASVSPGPKWHASILNEALPRGLDVTTQVTSAVSLMRDGHSPFIHRTIVSRPSGSRRSVTVQMIYVSLYNVSYRIGHFHEHTRHNAGKASLCGPETVGGKPQPRAPSEPGNAFELCVNAVREVQAEMETGTGSGPREVGDQVWPRRPLTFCSRVWTGWRRTRRRELA
jgi:hypothetical protein